MLQIESCDIDDYLIVEDEDEESYDSDKIDSDIEAELYNSIHHEVASGESQDNHVEENNSFNILFEAHPNIKIDEPAVCDSVSKNDACTHVVIFPKATCSNTNHEVECNSNPLKRKSDMIANILENIQTNSKLNKKQKTKNNINSSKSKSQVNASNNKTVDDSDSDSSVIFIESDEQENFDTNITETFNFVDSDNSSIDANVRHFAPSLHRNDLHNASPNPVSNGDPWYINSTDLYRKKRASNRYHDSANVNCSNCNKKGHISKYCTERKITKCFICGGIHMGSTCQQKICSRCFQYGHDKWRCFLREEMRCHLCNMIGHTVKSCPDLWRRYHLTTSGKKIIKGKPVYQNTSIYCFNCGHQGHYGFHCSASRKGDSPPTYPSVISYENPKIVNRNMVVNAPPTFPHSLPNQQGIQKIQNKTLQKKAKKKLKRTLKRLQRLETRIESTNKRDEVNFPRSSKDEKFKNCNAENKESKNHFKRRGNFNAKAKIKRRKIAREAAKLKAMLGQ